jgi:hypothetical protein
VKKMPNWQANNFSDLIFLVELCAGNFIEWRENCGSVD